MTASAQITALLLEQGCEIPDIPILQPAEPFLETIGEDIRRRMFTTSGDDGVEMCLRPEFTIPICLHWLAGDNRSAGRFGYFGPVFRRQRRTSNEFQQAGVEDFGAPDSLAADARILGDALAAVSALGGGVPTIRFGDPQLFHAVTGAMNLTPADRSRLRRAFGHDATMNRELGLADRLNSSADLPAAIQQALLIAEDEAQATAITEIITQQMAERHYAPAGRSAADIARRLIDKHRPVEGAREAEHAQLLKAVLDLDVPLSGAVDALRDLLPAALADTVLAQVDFGARVRALEDVGVDSSKVHLQGGFGRRLDYYTGMVFELLDTDAQRTVLAAGGRYDRLMQYLGYDRAVPSVGYSLWVDRIARREAI